MRLLDTKTRYFDQDTFQIPQLENTWGCMIDFLDTTLVNGSQGQPILGLTVAEDSKYPDLYWLITIQLNKDHGYKSNLSVVEIVNSNIEVFNQVYRVQEVTETTIILALPKVKYPLKPENLVYLVGVEIKTPALGYEKVFEGLNKAVYKVTTREDKVCFLRVDNSCPSGWDPSWAKFSRVSMFEDMRHVDDYDIRLGIKKAPAYSDDYNRVETKVYNIWLNTSDNGFSQFSLKRPPNTTNQKTIIIGDSSTFYLHREGLTRSGSGARDETYIFGAYLKYCYKEDPLPFILRSSQSESVDGDITLMYNRYSAIHRDRDWDNHTFNTEGAKLYEIPKSNKFANWLSDHYRSGTDTRISFRPYKNELPFNLVNLDLRFFRTDQTILEGRYRGLKIIINDLKEYLGMKPPNYSVFIKNSEEYFFILPCREYHDNTWGSDCFVVRLEDWEGL